MQNIAFIGMGNMGTAIAKGLKNNNINNLSFISKDKNKAKIISDEMGIEFSEDLETLISKSKYIVLAIKPQIYKEILNKLKDILNPQHILISLAPGIKIFDINKLTGNKKVVRAMPNMPAVISQSMTAISYNEEDFTKDEIEDLSLIFSSFGKFIKIDEKNMEAVVCMSGSSPAYIYTFIDSLANSGLKLGLKKDEAIRLVAETMIASAKLLLESNEHPIILRDKICSPSGTTISGLMELEKNNFSKAIQEASLACYKRCLELSDF